VGKKVFAGVWEFMYLTFHAVDDDAELLRSGEERGVGSGVTSLKSGREKSFEKAVETEESAA